MTQWPFTLTAMLKHHACKTMTVRQQVDNVCLEAVHLTNCARHLLRATITLSRAFPYVIQVLAAAAGTIFVTMDNNDKKQC